jgi:hypothetical protein
MTISLPGATTGPARKAPPGGPDPSPTTDEPDQAADPAILDRLDRWRAGERAGEQGATA